MSIAGLPQVAASALPAEIRSASKGEQEDYRAALGFERVLIGQLVSTMTKTAPLAEGPQAAMVQDALADALTTGGGLGLASQIYASLHPATAEESDAADPETTA
jgi:Rod binding domain-containing protein